MVVCGLTFSLRLHIVRYGKAPSGIIGSTLNETTLAIWALSLGVLGQLRRDLQGLQDGNTRHWSQVITRSAAHV